LAFFLAQRYICEQVRSLAGDEVWREAVMGVSPDADVLMRDIRELRAARQLAYQRDMEVIDAEYDQRLRKIQRRSGRSACTSSFIIAMCARRRRRRDIRRLVR
jgi:hypothetical protein